MKKVGILIVEDEAIIAMEIENSLQNLGYEVVSIVDNGDDAIEKADTDRPDIILMDIRIKGEMDGIDAAAIIRNRFGIPVIFSTAYLDKKRIERAKVTLPFGYLLKPIHERDLKVTLEMALYVSKVEVDRKKAESDLKKSEANYRELVEFMPQGLFEADEMGNLTYANHSALEMFEYTDDDLTNGINILQIIATEDRERAAINASKLMDGQQLGGIEYSAITQKGLEFPVMVYSSALIYAGKTVHRGIIIDVSEQKLAKEKLQESEEKYRIAFKTSPDAVNLAQMDGLFVDINNGFTQITGYSAEDVIGKRSSEIGIWAVPEDREKLLNGITEDGHVENMESKFRCKDGSIIIGLISGSIITLNDEPHILTILKDITKRKKIEKALVSSQQRNLLHVEQTPLAVIEWSLAFEVEQWNPAAEKIFGYTKKEALGRHPIGLILADDARADMDEVWGNLIHLKGGERSTNENITKTGKIIYCEWYNTPLVDEYGEVIGVASLAQDITDRIQAEKELRLTKYSVDHSFAAEFWIKQNGHFHYANNAASLLTGYSHQELLGLCLWDLDHSFAQGNFSQDWQKFEENGTYTFESTCFDKTGLQIPVEITTNYQDFEGEKYIFAYVLNITERRKYEMERTRLVSAIEQSSDNVVITDIKGNIEYVNPAFERNTGYSRSEIFGQHPQILRSGKHNNDFYQNLWAIITNGEIWTGNITNKRKDGKLIEEFATIFPVLASSGEIKNFVAVSHDITEQNRIENQLRESQKMEAVGTLASGIAHDFNNILTPIFACSQLLERKLKNENDKIPQLINYIRKAAFRASSLVTQIQNLNRKHESKKVVVDTMPIIKETLKLFHSALPSTINIKASFEAISTCVLCDPTQIHQVIMNLGTNASHAMRGKNGTLEVKTSNYTETKGNLGIEKGNYLLITVRDTGVGMSQKTKERIFEPFFTTKKVGEGTGLGLSVTYRIIETLGGYIHVYSELNKGTKFHIYLPLDEGKPIEDSKTPEQILTGDETVLLVDDEELNVFSYSALLEDQGYTVDCFTESLKAYEAFISNPAKYDLILTDYTMPNMTGLKLTEKIREQNFETPVVLISGLSEVISDDDLEKAKIKKILSKPIDLYDLAVAVRNVLDK